MSHNKRLKTTKFLAIISFLLFWNIALPVGTFPPMIDLGAEPGSEGTPLFRVIEESEDSGFGQFGRAAFGDVNDDGLQDIIIGAPGADREGSPGGAADDTGKVYIFFGSLNPPWGETIDLNVNDDLTTYGEARIIGDKAGDMFGESVASGDVNGDGIDDIIVGSPGFNHPNQTDGGAVFIIYGRKTLGAEVIDLATTINDISPAGETRFISLEGIGESVEAADLSLDGFSEVITAGTEPPDGVTKSTVFILYGRAGLENSLIDLELKNGLDLVSSENETRILAYHFDLMGYSISAGADFNGDGWPDVAIGAPGKFGQGSGKGAVWVLNWTPVLTATQIDTVSEFVYTNKDTTGTMEILLIDSTDFTSGTKTIQPLFMGASVKLDYMAPDNPRASVMFGDSGAYIDNFIFSGFMGGLSGDAVDSISYNAPLDMTPETPVPIDDRIKFLKGFVTADIISQLDGGFLAFGEKGQRAGFCVNSLDYSLFATSPQALGGFGVALLMEYLAFRIEWSVIQYITQVSGLPSSALGSSCEFGDFDGDFGNELWGHYFNVESTRDGGYLADFQSNVDNIEIEFILPGQVPKVDFSLFHDYLNFELNIEANNNPLPEDRVYISGRYGFSPPPNPNPPAEEWLPTTFEMRYRGNAFDFSDSNEIEGKVKFDKNSDVNTPGLDVFAYILAGENIQKIPDNQVTVDKSGELPEVIFYIKPQNIPNPPLQLNSDNGIAELTTTEFTIAFTTYGSAVITDGWLLR